MFSGSARKIAILSKLVLFGSHIFQAIQYNKLIISAKKSLLKNSKQPH